LRNRLFKWTFIINVKATILHSFLHHRLIWIGKSYNPDYTQSCTGIAGTPRCRSDPSDPCPPAGGNCVESCTGGTCGCPAPLPNSSQVASNCAINYIGLCVCRLIGACLQSGMSCPCENTCGYNCDLGFTWNGVQCVSAKILRRLLVGVGL
jgi:hypothetical protein